MRALLPVLLLLSIAAPALAQTTASPIEGAYDEVYVVAGRALDSRGQPVPQATLVVEMPGAKPLRAAANCKGDFITSFPLRAIDPEESARITLVAPPGGENVTTSVPLDPFYRRSDAILRLGSPWPYACPENQNVFAVSASVAVRLLNRTEPYEREGETFHARPYTGLVRMRFETPDGAIVCPPHPQSGIPGDCEIFQPDARGDVRYTFTLDQPFAGGGRIDLILQDDRTIDVPIDATTRIGVKYVEVTGQGVPAELYGTPLPGALALASLAGAALGARSLFSRRLR